LTGNKWIGVATRAAIEFTWIDFGMISGSHIVMSYRIFFCEHMH